MKNWLAAGALCGVAVFATSVIAENDDNKGKRVFRAQLVGLNEVPSVSTAAKGSFYAIVNPAGDAFTYWLSYSGLGFDAAQGHIHFGQHHTNGGISVWLCEATVAAPATVAANVPPCAARATTTPITATITAADVVGPGGQGISAGEFAELLAAMRAGAAYANVHSGTAAVAASAPGVTPVVQAVPAVGFPGGEIRGQIN
jgi:hypothetical protein